MQRAAGEAQWCEVAVFEALRSQAGECAGALAAAARALAVLDVTQGLADAAVDYGLSRPEVDASHALRLRGARHLVVEASLQEDADAGGFVPNDLTLGQDPGDDGGHHVCLLTGPNMGGKSTYLRQCGQAVVMAQAGSFVPAASAQVGIVDRIFRWVALLGAEECVPYCSPPAHASQSRGRGRRPGWPPEHVSGGDAGGGGAAGACNGALPGHRGRGGQGHLGGRRRRHRAGGACARADRGISVSV